MIGVTQWFCQECGWLSEVKVQNCRDCGTKMDDLHSRDLNVIRHYVGMKRRAIEYRKRIRKHGLDPDDVKRKISAAFSSNLEGDALKAELLGQGVDLDLIKKTWMEVVMEIR
jgi:hypothetical protein